MKRIVPVLIALFTLMIATSVALAQANTPISLTENPVVIAVLAIVMFGGAKVTRGGVAYFAKIYSDSEPLGGKKFSANVLRLLSFVIGIATAIVLYGLKFLDAPQLLEYPVWLRIVGVGLVCGFVASGDHDVSTGSPGVLLSTSVVTSPTPPRGDA
jgi:uncharacterized membrane protein YoaK (UPF0700 family)